MAVASHRTRRCTASRTARSSRGSAAGVVVIVGREADRADDHRLLLRQAPPWLAEEHSDLVAAAVIARPLLAAPLRPRPGSRALGRDDRLVDLVEGHHRHAGDLDRGPAVPVIVHDRQPLPDARRTAFELALAHERDGDGLAAGEDLADEVLAETVVRVVAE